MFLKKLRGNPYGFFELFNRHAATTTEGAQCLLKICETFPNIGAQVSRIEELEHECDSIVHLTMDLLHHSFITPLDREEIIKIISRMDDIMDLVDSTAKTMVLYDLPALPEQLRQLISILTQAQAKAREAVELIHGFKGGDSLREIIKEIHSLENEGDRTHHAGIGELFRRNADQPLLVIKLKAIYESVEEAIDRCEDVADTVESVVLEHF